MLQSKMLPEVDDRKTFFTTVLEGVAMASSRNSGHTDLSQSNQRA